MLCISSFDRTRIVGPDERPPPYEEGGPRRICRADEYSRNAVLVPVPKKKKSTFEKKKRNGTEKPVIDNSIGQSVLVAKTNARLLSV